MTDTPASMIPSELPEQFAFLRKPSWTRQETAAFLGLKPQTLADWATSRTQGPPFVRISARCIRYRAQDVLDWMKRSTVQPSRPSER